MGEYTKGFLMGVALTVVTFMVLSTCGCSGFHAVVHKDPDVALLTVTPDDVTQYMKARTGEAPIDPDTVLYVPDKDAYMVKAPYMDEAMGKVVMYDILTDKDHIQKFIKEYEPDTVGKAFKRSAVDMLIGAGAAIAVIFGLLGL